MKLVQMISLLLLFCEEALCLTKEFIYVSSSMTYIDARKYCQQNYSDLATMRSQQEYQKLKLLIHDLGWIGLIRNPPKSSSFQWVDGEPLCILKWNHPEPTDVNENCTVTDQNGWRDTNCVEPRPFYCYLRLILVKEEKTWDEALEFCMRNYTGLVSLTSPFHLTTALIEIEGTGAESGKWFWLNKVAPSNLGTAHSCPPKPYQCGARNFVNNTWENRDCSERLYFLCF